MIFQKVARCSRRAGCHPERPVGNRGRSTASSMPARNEVERLFGRLKQYRRVGTRYDKLDLMFAGFIYLILICEMIRNLGKHALV